MKSLFKNIIAGVVFVGFSSLVYSQNVTMGDVGFPETNPANCNTFGTSGNNFYDDGGAANYSANFNDTTVFCPDLTLGTKMTLTFAINAGFEFNVHGSDSIYVYDGPDTSAPLLGVHNSDTDPNGFAYTASWGNPSGCLTVVFISNGANEGTGWVANAQCGNQNQPFTPHIEAFVNGVGPNALNPIDTGFVDVCFGDSILFVAKPIFPYSFENTGYGYSQNVDNVDYDWYISDGGTYANNDSVWFTPPTRNGFLVDLKITDAFPQIERILCKVRVSQQPLFTGTGPLEDTVCLGQNTVLIGGVTLTDTVGTSIPAGTFELGGSFAGLTYLPDGSGAQYQAPIDIGGFPDGSTISNSQDLNQVCITMEHSYLGDLEIALQCPNGTQVTLLNSYAPGFIPGGVSGVGTYMGDPIDDVGGGGPGEGWEYCFSSVFNTWGDYPTEIGAGNTIPAPVYGNNGPSLNPNGVYLPEQDFSTFAGCPVNGQWTIIVQDNLGIDDGYIFEWGLYFDPSFFTGLAGYQNTISYDEWLDDPSIISGQDDTLLVIQPTTPGYTNYTYVVTDNFGCEYDTTVALFVLPLPTIFDDTIACYYNHFITGTTSYAGGVWSSADTAITFLPSPNVENPNVVTSTAGTYTVTYTDNACGVDVSAEIYFYEYPWTWFNDTLICEGVTLVVNAPNENPDATEYIWSDGQYGTNVAFSEPGYYEVTLTNACHSSTAGFNLDYQNCFVNPPNVISLAPGSQNSLWYVDLNGIKEFEVVITNRWGNVVFECKDQVGLCSWNGRSQSGDFVQEGTYFYLINALTEGDEQIQKHGFIQVVN